MEIEKYWEKDKIHVIKRSLECYEDKLDASKMVSFNTHTVSVKYPDIESIRIIVSNKYRPKNFIRYMERYHCEEVNRGLKHCSNFLMDLASNYIGETLNSITGKIVLRKNLSISSIIYM